MPISKGLVIIRLMITKVYVTTHCLVVTYVFGLPLVIIWAGQGRYETSGEPSSVRRRKKGRE
jgi:hypothetical protein